jgi:peptidoglycan-associated lipoprotein
MKPGMRRLAKMAVIVVAGAAMAACASHPKPLGPVGAAPPPPPPPSESGAMPAPGPGPVEQGQNSGAPTPGSVRDFVVNVGDRVYFDFNQYELRNDAKPILDAQAAWLQRYPQVQVRIEGNCDERGTREYNFALGARRANQVKTFLIAHGVSGDRITTVSYGKEHPIDTSGGPEAFAHNRNAHTD